ncbi:MAG: hypothetical protein HPY45_10115 [Anaerolineae bacterium]|nr:hypothetical protein [Anaerolineae bacterium]
MLQPAPHDTLGVSTPTLPSSVPWQPPQATALSSPTAPASATPPATPSSTPTPHHLPTTQYDIKAKIDYKTLSLEVNEAVIFSNKNPLPLENLLFVVEANQKPGMFTLNALHWEDDTSINTFTLTEDTILVPLKQALPPGRTATLAISYTLKLPQRQGTLGYTSRQINIADWYPVLPAYSPQSGWLVHPPHLVGEHLVYDIADYSVELQLINFPSETVIAASTPCERVGNTLTFFAQQARNFTLSISSEYKKLSRNENGVLLSAYVFSEHEQAGINALNYMADAITLFSEMFHPYPRNSLTLVEWQNQDGMEYDGLFFLNWNYFEYAPGGARSGLASMVVHETAHQWWYALVGNDPAVEPWLDEALCTYSEKLFYEQRYPELLSWWWDYRIHHYKPEGAVNKTIYEFAAYRPYVNATYLRGALFLEDLRNVMGEEAFFNLLSEYAKQYQGKLAKSQDFFDIAAEISPVSLSELTNRYFIPTP